jgi:hypothetical protein
VNQREYLITRVVLFLYPFGSDDRLRQNIVPYLNQYSDDLLHTLDELFDGNAEHAGPIKTSVAQKRPEGAIREHLEFFPLMPDRTQLSRRTMVNGLRSYRQLPETDDLTSMGPELVSQCKALILAVLAVGQGEAFTDDRIVDLIIAHADEVERVISIIAERGTSEPALISDLLSSEAPALSEGRL